MKKDTKDSAVQNSLMQQANLGLLESEIKQREASLKQIEFNTACNKIEQARRNVEIVSKVISTFQDDIKKKMTEVLMLNLEILKETSKL